MATFSQNRNTEIRILNVSVLFVSSEVQHPPNKNVFYLKMFLIFSSDKVLVRNMGQKQLH